MCSATTAWRGRRRWSSAVGGSPTTTGNGFSSIAALSADGNIIAFESGSTNLLAGQTTSADNVYLYDASLAAQGLPPLTLVSHVSDNLDVGAGAASGGDALRKSDSSNLGGPFQPDSNLTNKFLSLSLDGRFVSYQSWAFNLVPNQTEPPTGSGYGFLNTFVFDSQSLTNTLVSGVNGSGQNTGNRGSVDSLVTSNGSVILLSTADNLIAGTTKTDGSIDIFVSHAAGQPPLLVTRSAFQAGPQSFVYSASADGRYVVFTSNATNVVPGQLNSNSDQNVFLLDRLTNTRVLVSHTPESLTTTGDQGSPGSLPAATIAGVPAVISADGNFVAFVSSADNLVPNQNPYPITIYSNIYLYNVQTAQVTLISGTSPTATGVAAAFRPVISADGQYVAFTSTIYSFLKEVVVYNRITNTSQVISRPDDGDSDYASISDDGLSIVYQSRADDLMIPRRGAGPWALRWLSRLPGHRQQRGREVRPVQQRGRGHQFHRTVHQRRLSGPSRRGSDQQRHRSP